MERSKKVVFVSHCLLNQNARAVDKERFAGPFKDMLELFAESGIGIVQLPCPEMEFNGGLNRKIKTDHPESAMYRNSCKKLSVNLISQIENYIKNNYHVVGILGVEFSSTCAVHQVQNGRKNVPGKGVLMEEIEKEMQKKNFQVPIVGVNIDNTFSSLEKIQSLLKFST
jgi:predicted secreted protein